MVNLFKVTTLSLLQDLGMGWPEQGKLCRPTDDETSRSCQAIAEGCQTPRQSSVRGLEPSVSVLRVRADNPPGAVPLEGVGKTMVINVVLVFKGTAQPRARRGICSSSYPSSNPTPWLQSCATLYCLHRDLVRWGRCIERPGPGGFTALEAGREGRGAESDSRQRPPPLRSPRGGERIRSGLGPFSSGH